MNKKGFTLIELIVTISIIVLLIGISVPSYLFIHNRSKIESDRATIAVLNESTSTYAAMNKLQNKDVFEGISDNTERMQKLVDEEYLAGIVIPKQDGETFEWIIENQMWKLGTNVIKEAPSVEITPSPQQTLYRQWVPDRYYFFGTRVTYNGANYWCWTLFSYSREPGAHWSWIKIN